MRIKTEMLKADIEEYLRKIRNAKFRIMHEQNKINRHLDKIKKIREVMNNESTKASIGKPNRHN